MELGQVHRSETNVNPGGLKFCKSHGMSKSRNIQ